MNRLLYVLILLVFLTGSFSSFSYAQFTTGNSNNVSGSINVNGTNFVAHDNRVSIMIFGKMMLPQGGVIIGSPTLKLTSPDGVSVNIIPFVGINNQFGKSIILINPLNGSYVLEARLGPNVIGSTSFNIVSNNVSSAQGNSTPLVCSNQTCGWLRAEPIIPPGNGNLLVDYFMQDSFLNRDLWTGLNQTNLSFSNPDGLEMVSGGLFDNTVSSNYYVLPPFTIQTMIRMDRFENGGYTLGIANPSTVVNEGISLNIVPDSSDASHNVAYMSYPLNPNTSWYREPSPFSSSFLNFGTWYQVTMTVDPAGNATIALSQDGHSLGTSYREIGKGPFNLWFSLGRSDYVSTISNNEMHVQWITVSSSVVPNSISAQPPIVQQNLSSGAENSSVPTNMSSSSGNNNQNSPLSTSNSSPAQTPFVWNITTVVSTIFGITGVVILIIKFTREKPKLNLEIVKSFLSRSINNESQITIVLNVHNKGDKPTTISEWKVISGNTGKELHDDKNHLDVDASRSPEKTIKFSIPTEEIGNNDIIEVTLEIKHTQGKQKKEHIPVKKNDETK